MNANRLLRRRWVVFAIVVLVALVLSPHSVLSQAPAAFDDALNQANVLLRQRNYEEALKLFRKANGMKNNSSPECLWGMAQAYNKMRALKDAIEVCNRLVEVARDDAALVAAACNLKGLSLFAQGTTDKRDRKKCAEAEAAFRKALEAQPDLHVAHFNVGMMLMCQEQDAAGAEEMKLYLEREPKGPYAKEAERMIENPRRVRENYAPDFALVTADGSYLNSDDLRGKVIVLDFWATWCKPCVDSLDDVVRLARRYEKDGAVVISVSGDTDQAKWREFLGRNAKMTWPQFLDNRGQMRMAFGVRGIPAYVVIDQEGILRLTAVGSNRIGEVSGAVRDCLRRKPS